MTVVSRRSGSEARAALTSVVPGSGRLPGGVVLLGIVAAAVAAWMSVTVFRHGSIDNDDAVYLLQARALLHGRLTVPLSSNPAATQPWFFAITRAGYVAKYLPAVAAIYAASLWASGSTVPVLALMAFALPLVLWRLGRAVGLSPRRAVLAALILTLSPAVLVQGGLVLSYLPFLLILVLAWTLLLGIWQGAGRVVAAGFGFLAAVAGCLRPLDGLLLLGPAALWVAWRLRRRACPLALFAAAGALPLVGLVAAYDMRVTGSAFRLPFGLPSPRDKLGYGLRQLVPQAASYHFGPLQGLYGGYEHFVAGSAAWMLGFLLVAPLAVWNLRRGGQASSGMRLLAVSAAVFVGAYLMFWGPWNASVLWGGTSMIGPFYALPVMVPVALCACAWLPTRAFVRDRLVVGAAVLAVAAVGWNVWTAVDAVVLNASAARTTAGLLDAVHALPPGPVLLDDDPPYLAHPVGVLGEQSLTGHGRLFLESARLDQAQVAHLRPSSLLQVRNGRAGRFSYRLLRVRRISGAAVAVRVTDPLAGRGTLLVVSRDGRLDACPLAAGVDLQVDATATSGCAGRPLPAAARALPYRLCGSDDCLSVSMFTPYDRRGRQRWSDTGWRLTRLAVGRGEVTTLVDGRVLAQRGEAWVSITAVPAADGDRARSAVDHPLTRAT